MGGGDPNQGIKSTAAELAVLCRAASLRDDLPGNSELHTRLWRDIDEAIITILDDRNMAVDPIEWAIWELTNEGHVDGLQELASALLRHRDDYGNWAARRHALAMPEG